jgi:hypothetical protein
MSCSRSFNEETQNCLSLAPRISKTTSLLPFFVLKTASLLPFFLKQPFIKGEMYGYYMAKRRGKRQRFTRQVRASIKDFLRGVEFAPMGEILAHVVADDTLEGLSRKGRREVAFTVMRPPTFYSFKTVNSVRRSETSSMKRPQTLWKVNECYEEFVPFKKD